MRLVVLTGTSTAVGKTFVTVALARLLLQRGQTVAARKPVQSYAEDEAERDAARLAQATGEDEALVCAPGRSFGLAMAPPIAARLLGQRAPSVAELARELGQGGSSWPARIDVGLVELVGGLRSPLGRDGDCLDLIGALDPSLVVLVADAGLGAINAVRLCATALRGVPTLVYLNRFLPGDQVCAENLAFLSSEGHLLVTNTEDLARHVLGEAGVVGTGTV